MSEFPTFVNLSSISLLYPSPVSATPLLNMSTTSTSWLVDSVVVKISMKCL